jgi:hypothetical protein
MDSIGPLHPCIGNDSSGDLCPVMGSDAIGDLASDTATDSIGFLPGSDSNGQIPPGGCVMGGMPFGAVGGTS